MTQAPDPSEPVPSATDRFLDHIDESLMPEQKDRQPPDRYKNRFVQFAIMVMIFIFFMMVVTYFVALVYRIPLPDSDIFKSIVDAIVTILKLFAAN